MKNFYQTRLSKRFSGRFSYEKQFVISSLFDTMSIRMIYRTDGHIYYIDTQFTIPNPMTELNRTCIARQLQQAKKTLMDHVHSIEKAAINQLYADLQVSTDEHIPRMV
jgi:hypothetical protein